MKVGTYLPQRSMDRASLDVAREAEHLGFASVAVLDHVIPLGAPMGTPIQESFTTLAAAAAVTEVVGLRTVVTRAGLRPPVMTAHLARTLEAFAPGRLTVGVGSGDAASRREDELVGLPDVSMDERRAQVRLTIATLEVWVPGVPLWIGGAAETMQRLAGELADGWNVWGATPAEMAAGLAVVAAAATEAGRPVPVATWAGQVLLGGPDRVAAWQPGRPEDRDRALTGDADAVASRLRALGEAGVTEAVVAFVGGEAAAQRRDFARHVLPSL